jgi:CubicO group peptidase (beta-lactamase class C family)
MGMNSDSLLQAVVFAMSNEARGPRDLERWMNARGADDPYSELLGSLRPRGGPAGLVVRGGYIVAEWGDTRRADVTYSVTKSFLATTTLLALQDGVIRSVDDLVADYVPDGTFSSPHNAPITWRHLLTQTSEWEGELFGKPDVADRRLGRDRELRAPGTLWEYNDVRVNLAGLATMRVWQRPLPDVLRERIMNPIGASDTWEWHGYRTSRVELGADSVTAVSGGGHWGGGLWISARDQARFGLLLLRRGRWQDRQLLAEEWIDSALTPIELNPTYGYMWWLNTDHKLWPGAPATSFAARGGGSNVIWIDPEHDLVVVMRWIDGPSVAGMINLVLNAVERESLGGTP